MNPNIVPPIECVDPKLQRKVYRLYVRGTSYDDILCYLFVTHGIVSDHDTIDMIIDFYNQILL